MNTIEQAREVSKKLRSPPIAGLKAYESEAADILDTLITALERIQQQEPVAGKYAYHVKIGAPDARDIENGWRPLFLAAGAQPVTPKMIAAGQLACMTAEGVDPVRVYLAMRAVNTCASKTAESDTQADLTIKPDAQESDDLTVAYMSGYHDGKKASQEQRNPLSNEQIRKWWASENGLEDCDMCKIDDFTKAVRAFEAKMKELNT